VVRGVQAPRIQRAAGDDDDRQLRADGDTVPDAVPAALRRDERLDEPARPAVPADHAESRRRRRNGGYAADWNYDNHGRSSRIRRSRWRSSAHDERELILRGGLGGRPEPLAPSPPDVLGITESPTPRG